MEMDMTDSSVVQVDHDELRTLVNISFYSKQPLFVWGPTGIGKSTVLEEQAEEIAEQNFADREIANWNEASEQLKEKIRANPQDYFVFKDIRLSEYQPSDIKGIPDLDGDVVEWKPPVWVEVFAHPDAAGIIFLDECNLAVPQVQSAFYKLILDRQVGETTIGEDVGVFAAGNRSKDGAHTYDMAGPLRNRFSHAHLNIPSAGEDGNWTKWAHENGKNAKVVSYLSVNARAKNLFKFDEQNRDNKAFPTPRQWAALADALDVAEERTEGLLDLDTVKMLATSKVGRGAATDFVSFIEQQQKIDLEKYLDNPDAAAEIKQWTSVEKKHAAVTGLAEMFRNSKDTDMTKNIFGIAVQIDKELGALLLRLMRNYDEETFDEALLENHQYSNKVSEEYLKLLSKIGVDDPTGR